MAEKSMVGVQTGRKLRSGFDEGKKNNLQDHIWQ
jgi:hypothetical protein